MMWNLSSGAIFLHHSKVPLISEGEIGSSTSKPISLTAQLTVSSRLSIKKLGKVFQI